MNCCCGAGNDRGDIIRKCSSSINVPYVLAEQSLRHMVIFRKVCFGTRSDKGLKTHSIIPTLVQTARRQGVHPREFLHILYTKDTATAQAALYNNSG